MRGFLQEPTKSQYRMTTVTMKCDYHPDRDATGICVNCGKLVCDACKAVLEGKIYCALCSDKMALGKADAWGGKGQAQGEKAVMCQMVVQRIVEGKNSKKIAEELVQAGWSEESATHYVSDTEQQFKQSPDGRQILASKHKRGMLYSMLWVGGGLALTALAQGFLIFWGAVVFGLYDFFKNLVGWLKYR